MRETKLILTALAATMLLGTAVSTATARNLSVSERNFEFIWNMAQAGKTELTFRAESGSPMSCNVTLLGGFTENTIAKVNSANIGTINHGEIGTCSAGTATILTETFPWRITYQGFTGTLPRITQLRLLLVGAAFRVREPGGIECLAGTTERQPATGEIEEFEASGSPESLRVDEAVGISLGGFVCSFASPAHFSGKGLIRNLPGTSKIRLQLIGGTGPIVTPEPIDFGSLEVESLVRRTVTLTAGSEALTVRRLSVRSGNYFAITDPNRCVGARLEASRSCAFRVLFSAPGESREFSDTVIVETTVRTIEDSVRART